MLGIHSNLKRYLVSIRNVLVCNNIRQINTIRQPEATRFGLFFTAFDYEKTAFFLGLSANFPI